MPPVHLVLERRSVGDASSSDGRVGIPAKDENLFRPESLDDVWRVRADEALRGLAQQVLCNPPLCVGRKCDLRLLHRKEHIVFLTSAMKERRASTRAFNVPVPTS